MKTKPLFGAQGGGPEVSVIGLGCNNFGMRIDESETDVVVNTAIDAGINFFDTAEMYGGGGKSEEYLGAALGARRKNIILATKFGYNPDGSKNNVVKSVEGSLKRLKTDYIDLYQLHKPDDDTPIEETLAAMDKLIQEGKVRYIGCSNFSAEQLDQAAAAAESSGTAPFVTLQNRYSILHGEPEESVLPACERHDVGFLPFFPLENGLLTGKHKRGVEPGEDTRIGAMDHFRKMALTDDNFTAVEKLEEFVSDKGHTLLELAFSWLAAQPQVVSVIAGATKAEQINANAAAGDWTLSADDLAEVASITGRA